MITIRLLFLLIFSISFHSSYSQIGDSSINIMLDSSEGIFKRVEIAAKVNATEWKRHLEKNLIPIIESAAKKGIKPGAYTINLRFLVEKDGSISEVKAMNDPGYGLGKGAVKVLKSGPKWIPGEQNGKKVRSYHTQPITFVIAEG